MKKDTLMRRVARRTGVMLEAVDLVCSTFIEEIKEAVERGDTVRLNGFMQIYLHDKKDYTASAFVHRKGTGRFGAEYRERIVVKGHKVPWVKVSRIWRDAVIAKHGGQPPHHSAPHEHQDPNQMSIFDVIPKDND